MVDRLALFQPSLAGGGAERVFVTLANGFAAQGVRCELVVGIAQGPYRHLLDGRVNLIDLHARRVLAAVPGLVRYLQRENPPLLLSGQTHANLVVLLAAWLSGYTGRVIISEHHTLSAIQDYDQNRRERLLPLLARRFYPRADAVVAVSAGVADDLAAFTGLPRERITVIYNPVVTPELRQKACQPSSHPWLQSVEIPVILAAGRMAAAKDYGTLLRAFALLRQDRPARLVILGDGKERHHLEALAAELGVSRDLAMPGFDPNPFASMARASLFVLSSIREGFPNVLAEALACGAPVVSTDCPSGPAEILDHGRFGRLVPVKQPAALARAMMETLDQPGDPEARKQRAEEFSLEKGLAAYTRLFGSIVRQGGGF